MKLSEVKDHFGDQTACHSVIARKEAVIFIKPLSATGAEIPSLSDVKISTNAVRIEIFYLLGSVIVNSVGHRSAARTAVFPTWEIYLHMTAACIFINIFYDYIFQSEEFCYIIFHRAYRVLSCGVGNFSIKDFLVMLYFYFHFCNKNVGCSLSFSDGYPNI